MLALLAALSTPSEACFGCHYDTLISVVAVAEDGSLLQVVSMGSADAVTLFLPGGERTHHDLNASDPTALHTEDSAAEPRLNYARRKTEAPVLPEPWKSTYTNVLERDATGTWSGGGWTIKTTRTTVPPEEEGMGTHIEEKLTHFEGPCSILLGHPQFVEVDGVCKMPLPD
ncbi:MAG: hypothetical protein GY913_03910 [Proteobacteria bacterium]|nr:hypothetical protein [Pseudomonadota bacterium]MCP4916048.1 hypothetical protein [Pseudomonadota bacterium]